MEVFGLDEKFYLPISLIVSALVLSGTVFFVGNSVNNNLTGLTVAIQDIPSPIVGSGNDNTGDKGNVVVPTPTPDPTIDMEALANEDKIEGDPNAPVTIVEFSDFQCPFCGNFYTNTLLQLRTDYIDTGKVKLIYRDFPLSFHPEAQPAAEAAECAAEQGKFQEFHDKIFTNQAIMSSASYKQWAQEFGLNTQQFDDCVSSGKYRAEVQADFSEGQAAGVSGTPTFFINGQKVVGAQPYSVFKQIIDAELAN